MEQNECNSAGKDPLYMKLVMNPGQQPSTSSSSSQDSSNGVQKEGTVFKVQFSFSPRSLSLTYNVISFQNILKYYLRVPYIFLQRYFLKVPYTKVLTNPSGLAFNGVFSILGQVEFHNFASTYFMPLISFHTPWKREVFVFSHLTTIL